MVNLCVDTDHEGHLIVLTGDVLGGIAQIILAAEFLEADQVGMLGAQGKEQSPRALRNP